MAALLGSWWSGGSSEEKAKEESKEKGKEGEEEKEEASEQKDSSWVAGIGGLVRNVSEYAATVGETVRSTVQDTPFIGKFQEEQDKFAKEKRRQKDAAVPPWVGYNEEEQMKAQIMELSADSRNVLRNPPPGVQFHFDFTKSYPVAMAVLKEDSRLQRLRFDLVPKKISEQKFWHNYFYRVFLIKQSSQLASLTSAEQRESLSSDTTEEKTGGEEGEGKGEEKRGLSEGFNVSDPQSPSHEEFASDALSGVSGEISRESMRAELGQLDVAAAPGKPEPEPEENKQWEQQLQQELQDLELQGIEVGGGEGGGGEEVDSEAWEAELQEMLSMHSEEPAQN